MTLEILHDVDKGVSQLLNAPKDIEGGTPVSAYDGPIEGAHDELRRFFEVYLRGYPILYPHCERWWKGCIASEEGDGRSREDAVEAAFESRMAGPASAPEFVWFIRHFWLGCDGVNQKLPVDQRVAPEVVLLKWLADAGHRDYVTLLTCMPYWPIGLDDDGQWC